MIYEPCAGLDIGKDEVVTCIRVPDGARDTDRRSHLQTFSADLEALADWLTEHGSPGGDGGDRPVLEAVLAPEWRDSADRLAIRGGPAPVGGGADLCLAGSLRRLSKDYEYLTTTSVAVIYLAMTRLLLRRLTRP